MAFFDINLCLGRSAAGGKGWEEVDALLEAVNELGITGGLVAHQVAVEADILRGNALISEALEGHADLFPCWVMAPASLGDLPESHAWVHEAQIAGVRAVRLCPDHSFFSLEPWAIGPLFEALQEAQLPVLLDYGIRHWSVQPVPWDQVYQLCQAYPKLQMILLGATTGELRMISALMAQAPNFGVEMQTLNIPDLLPRFENRGWIDRLYFGSALPRCAPESPLHQVRRSAVGGHSLQKVARENAQRVLGIVPKYRVPPALPVSIYDTSQVIDIHGHCGAWERTQCLFREWRDFQTEMDRCGVAQLALSSFSAIHGDCEGGNQEMVDFIEQAPDQLRGYLVADPHAPKASLKQITRLYEAQESIVGLKLHCNLHGVQVQHPGYAPTLEYANTQAMPVLVHVGGQDDWKAVTQAYPKISFIMAHACLWDGVDEASLGAYALAGEIENLYVDLSGSGCHAGALRKLIDTIGLKKILFGSDFPLFDMAWAIGRVRSNAISPAEQKAILMENALRIMPRIGAMKSALG